ncbi:hypothetical protein [Mucilaginibacter sp. AK015]|uniref:hypothetical protein n=1 Tax=Mucilaginibacter sp. AK015 TaxID=2723072 RepID=UPI001608C3C0|nr:hypothetical protein [Mucilaginibacter sp. AK015]MBB5394229.1 hypothetical protein [Mucilaginibacter sp. AK015]
MFVFFKVLKRASPFSLDRKEAKDQVRAMLQPALPVLNAFFSIVRFAPIHRKKLNRHSRHTPGPLTLTGSPPLLKPDKTERHCERSVAIFDRKAAEKKNSTVLTSPPNAALACSDSTDLASAHPFTEQDAAATFLFGTFSFERKEKVHPLTVI